MLIPLPSLWSELKMCACVWIQHLDNEAGGHIIGCRLYWIQTNARVMTFTFTVAVTNQGVQQFILKVVSSFSKAHLTQWNHCFFLHKLFYLSQLQV